MKRTWRSRWEIGLTLLILFGCMVKESRFKPAKSPGDEFYKEQHAVFNSFDICELEEQVDSYWNYYAETNGLQLVMLPHQALHFWVLLTGTAMLFRI